MQRMRWAIIPLALLFLVSASAWAQDMIVFPAKGQSQEQTEKDKFDCYQWAKQQTGFDPMQVPKTSSPPPQQQARGGGGLRGAAGGAIAGAAVGKIAGKSGSKGAAYGAGAGALLGGMRQRGQRQNDERARQQWEQDQAAAYAQKRNTYNRAYSACLEGKGYTVK